MIAFPPTLPTYLESAWTVGKAIVAGLGGVAGIAKIKDWFFSGPKIVGQVEQKVSGKVVQDGNPNGCALFLLIYLVNKHVQPITIKGFTISALLDGRWVEGLNIHIRDGFRLPAFPALALDQERLYEKVGLNLLEYGKGVRGWMHVSFPTVEDDQKLRSATLKIELRDAFDKKHRWREQNRNAGEGLRFYPGAGNRQ